MEDSVQRLVEVLPVIAPWDLKEQRVRKSTSVTPTLANMVDFAVRLLEGLDSPANASRDTKEHGVTRKTDVTLIPACMMGCVWKLTTSWDSYVTALQGTGDLIVKIWILVTLILVLTLVLVFTPMMDIFVTVQWDSKEGIVKNEICANQIPASSATNVTKQESTATSVSRTFAIQARVCTMAGA